MTPLYVAVKMAVATKGLYSGDIHMIPPITSMLCAHVMQTSKIRVDFVYKKKKGNNILFLLIVKNSVGWLNISFSASTGAQLIFQTVSTCVNVHVLGFKIMPLELSLLYFDSFCLITTHELVNYNLFIQWKGWFLIY